MCITFLEAESAGLTKTLATEIAPSGVRVNAICPGFMEADMPKNILGGNPIKPASRHYPYAQIRMPLEIASVAPFLAFEASCFISGQAIAVDGGFTVR
jgi:3-oxoacyl-[acyl-carrier protein] reductase